MVAGDPHRRGHELGLPARTMRRHDQAAGHRVGDGRAVVEVDQVEAEVDGGGLAGGGQHAAVVRVEDVRVHDGLRMTGAELGGVRPVGGGPAAVQQARRSEDERTCAEGGDPGPRLVCRAYGLDQLRGRRLVDVRARGQDHGAGLGEPVQPVIRLDRERADPHRARAAEPDVVPAVHGFLRRVAEDLVGHAQLEVQQVPGGRQRDGVHVRKCTHAVVPDSHTWGPRPWRVDSSAQRRSGKS